jgi:hypothetical protein
VWGGSWRRSLRGKKLLGSRLTERSDSSISKGSCSHGPCKRGGHQVVQPTADRVTYVIRTDILPVLVPTDTNHWLTVFWYRLWARNGRHSVLALRLLRFLLLLLLIQM